MKKGQVWIETVIYTLIGLSLIAVILTLVTPKINEYRDRSVIEQTITSMNTLDKKLNEVLAGGAGNARTVEFGIKRGEITFDRETDEIVFLIKDSNAVYTEPGVESPIGRINILTEEMGNKHSVKLTLQYDADLEFSGSEDVKTFTPSSTPYVFRFEKNISGEDTQIIFTQVS